MISVAVLIDHPLEESAGGLVQCWKNLARAAGLFEKELRLDIHCLGKEKKKNGDASNVRYFTHPPLLAARKLFFLKDIPDDADLSPINPALLFSLSKNHYDLIHTTNTSLAFAKTGRLFSRWKKIPLTNSIQTDMPSYTKLYTEKILGKFFPQTLARWFSEKKYQASLKQLSRYLKTCDKIVTPLRRGVDKELFSPSKRKRDFLQDRFLLLFVGRVDEGKSVMTAVEATRHLLDQNQKVHLMIVGAGGLEEKIKNILGEHVTLAGILPQEQLPAIYASADLFIFPSQIEVCPNVVIEAKASGLPVLMNSKGSAARVIKAPGEDGLVLDSQDPKIWANEINKLIENRARLESLGRRGREQIQHEWPTWEKVFVEDILPIWKNLCSANGYSS